MKKFTIIVLIIMIAVLLVSCNANVTKKEEVKYYKSFEADYDNSTGKQQVTKSVTYNKDGSVSKETKTVFETGKLVKRIDYENGIICRVYEYLYSTVVDKVWKMTDTDYNTDGSIDNVCTYEYLYTVSTGNLRKETKYKNGIINYMDEYDLTTGKLIKETSYDKNGNVDYWWVYKYNTANNLTTEMGYQTGESSPYEKTTYEYDSNGNCTKEKYYNYSTLISTCNYVNVYDSTTGKLIKVTTYQDGSLSGIPAHVHEFDSETGAKIKYTRYYSSGKIQDCEEYDISTGKKTKYTEYDQDGNMTYIYEKDKSPCSYYYDAKGNVTGYSEEVLDSNGDRIKLTRYSSLS